MKVLNEAFKRILYIVKIIFKQHHGISPRLTGALKRRAYCVDPWRLAKGWLLRQKIQPCLRETMVRRMACISEMLGERRREMMRMRNAKWRVYITSETTNRWLTSSLSVGLTIGNIGWNRGQDRTDATILAILGPAKQWLSDIQP